MRDPERERPEVTTTMTSLAAASGVLHSLSKWLAFARGLGALTEVWETETAVPPFLCAEAALMAPAPFARRRGQGRYPASSSVVRQGSPVFPLSA